ncbi:MAG: 23S rRNA (pseudouridine(1915)-N(3))-methyltransferase RlmH [Acidobacteriota bacterium]
MGGADGVSRAIGEIADFRLSLSFMTFTHDMARVIILEQLYRAFTIINGFPYQK